MIHIGYHIIIIKYKHFKIINLIHIIFILNFVFIIVFDVIR
jgi:hypothetical protein